MREVTSQTAALTLGIKQKALDNLLGREGRRLLPRGRQGRGRRLPLAILEIVAVALLLKRDLGVSIARGLELAEQLAAAPNSRLPLGRLGTLHFDLLALRQSLLPAIAEAIESIQPPRRGRPRSPRTSKRQRGAS